jgi:hypothetical protein
VQLNKLSVNKMVTGDHLERITYSINYKEKVYFSSLKYCKSVTLILHVLFGANKSFNYLNWCTYHP